MIFLAHISTFKNLWYYTGWVFTIQFLFTLITTLIFGSLHLTSFFSDYFEGLVKTVNTKNNQQMKIQDHYYALFVAFILELLMIIMCDIFLNFDSILDIIKST